MANIPGGGELIIKPMSANISHNTEWFGKMDPYLELEFDGQIKKSGVCQKGGTTPTWTDTITFQRSRGFLLSVKLWDFQRFKAHDLIASTEVNLTDVITSGHKESNLELEYDGNVGAVVRVRFEFKRQESPQGQGLSSMMDSKKNSRAIHQQPYGPPYGMVPHPYQQPQPIMGPPQPILGVPQPVLGTPFSQPQATRQNMGYQQSMMSVQPPPFQQPPVGNIRSQDSVLHSNPYRQQAPSIIIPSKQSLPQSNGAISNPSNKQLQKKYTAEQMDALLN